MKVNITINLLILLTISIQITCVSILNKLPLHSPSASHKLLIFDNWIDIAPKAKPRRQISLSDNTKVSPVTSGGTTTARRWNSRWKLRANRFRVPMISSLGLASGTSRATTPHARTRESNFRVMALRARERNMENALSRRDPMCITSVDSCRVGMGIVVVVVVYVGCPWAEKLSAAIVIPAG